MQSGTKQHTQYLMQHILHYISRFRCCEHDTYFVIGGKPLWIHFHENNKQWLSTLAPAITCCMPSESLVVSVQLIVGQSLELDYRYIFVVPYFRFKYDFRQKYYAPQVWSDQGSNSWPPDHDSTFHVTETPALTTRPSVTAAIQIIDLNILFRRNGLGVALNVTMPSPYKSFMHCPQNKRIHKQRDNQQWVLGTLSTWVNCI